MSMNRNEERSLTCAAPAPVNSRHAEPHSESGRVTVAAGQPETNSSHWHGHGVDRARIPDRDAGTVAGP